MKNPNRFNKIIKLSFLFVFVSSLCSFVYNKHIEEGKKASYKKFLAEFEQVQIPSKLSFKLESDQDRLSRLANGDNVKKTPKKLKTLGDEYGDFIPGITGGRMSRMGPSTFQAEILVATTKKYSVLLYSKMPAYRGRKSYILATYASNGKEISKQYIGHSNDRDGMRLEINKKLEIVARAMHTEDNLHNKEINFFEKSKTAIFISDTGEILTEETLLNTKEKPMLKAVTTQEKVG